jgi:hypothetical protein
VSEKKRAKKRATAVVSSTAPKPKTPRRPKSAAARPRALVEAPPEKRFWVNCGPILKDLRELGNALAHNVSDAQFDYHVNASRNDFANWVEAVLEDAACSKALQRAKSRLAALRVVKTHLRRYT